ncbi:MAG: cytochrome b N-terminal domain-containing protein [Bryobacteraceae bacterium]
MRTISSWFNDRTGLITLASQFLSEEIPQSAGWPQAFGSVALFLCLVQAFSGILLSLNYAGTPGDAYNSLTYIIREVPMGRLIRGLHHWGASLMLIVVVLHMVQVFLYGAYKRPREATWIGGICLLLVTLGFSLTGYLLPWDNRAYWGTVVTTKIMGQAPIVGSYLQQMLDAGEQIGVVAFARFYSLHVFLFPAITILLVIIHLHLVRRHGVTPAPHDVAPKKAFYPEQVFRDTLACFVALIILLAAALLLRAPLERLADPTDASYVPRPEWYFLFLFQLLKFFKGAWEPVGSIGIPTVLVILLFLVPFIDRSRVKALRQRTLAMSVVALALAGWTTLTLGAARSNPPPAARSAADALVTSDLSSLSAQEMAGLGYFRRERCRTCHNLTEGPPKPGPTLTLTKTKRSAEWMIEHFRNPSQTIPGSNMPPIHLGMPELNALSAFLLRLTPETATLVDTVPPETIKGAQIYVTSNCSSCHKIAGIGGEIGPSLNGVAARRSKDWIEKHFESPQTLSPGTVMPPFHFVPAERDALVGYLLALP